MTDLVDLLVGRLAATPLPTEGRTPEEIGVLAHLRDALLAAGTAHVRRLAAPASWLQLGVSFADPEQAGRFRASGLLPDAVERWLAEGRIDRFFFMSKPPGLRLRFSVPRGQLLEPLVVGLLERARAEGLLDRLEFGVYDAETHQFGGPSGLDLFHAHSTADSLAILRFEALEAVGQTSIDRSVLSLLAMRDLVARAAGDPWEQWDAWRELERTGRWVDPADPFADELRADLADNRELLTAIVDQPDQVVAELTEAERALVARYAAANRALADGLREAARSRALSCGPRKILPFVVVFHWNRLGLDLDRQVALGFFMAELLDPKRERS